MSKDALVTPRWHEVVRANFAHTLGLVVAQTGECLKIQRDEQDLVPGRRFRPVPPDDLTSTSLGESWFVGVLLCPGDDTQAVSKWAASLPHNAMWRIRFYYVDGVDLRHALSAWSRAGLPDAPRLLVTGFRAFHRLYGRHHGDTVYRDATRTAGAPPGAARE